ncbi:MAG: PssD/Cps14F family polysaccharide biosynthesis glycosyltransferase [Deltaproteobacteria bacterium]
MFKKNSNIKIGIVCSHGGHLDDVLSIFEAFKGYKVFLVSYDVTTLRNFQYPGIEKFYYIKYFGDYFIGIFLNLLLSCFAYIRIFIKERPQVIFSTGSELAIPAFYIGKFLFHSKLIFLEQFTRAHTATITARCVYCISDLFLVQRESLLSEFGKKAKYAGSIL